MNSGLIDRRFVVVAGKGGVGKTTVAAVLGLAAARAGRRTLVCELHTRPKIARIFGHTSPGYEAVELAPNLHTMNIQPDDALREYGLRKLRFEAVFNAVFGNELMQRLLKMIPGMTELLLLGKAFDLERDREADGSPTWDTIIIDAPATGHGVSLLRLPKAILDAVGPGPMADEVGLMQELLVDPSRTVAHLVTLPEEMPVRETQQLLGTLRDELHIPVGHLFINGVWPTALDPADLVELEALGASEPLARGAVEAVRAMSVRRRFQEGYLAELAAELSLPSVQLPFLFTPSFDGASIESLTTLVERHTEGPPAP